MRQWSNVLHFIEHSDEYIKIWSCRIIYDTTKGLFYIESKDGDSNHKITATFEGIISTDDVRCDDATLFATVFI